MRAIESHVRTVIAKAINAQPENIRPETKLLGGIIPDGQMIAIQKTLQRDLAVKLPEFCWMLWTDVSDWIDGCERAAAAVREHRATDRAEGKAA